MEPVNMVKNANLRMDKLNWELWQDIQNTKQICAEHIIPLVFALMVHDATLSTIWTRLVLKSFKDQDHKVS